MIPIASGVRVWIATGHTDMRRGMNSLGLLVQEAFKRDPHGGDLYVFRGKSGKLISAGARDRTVAVRKAAAEGLVRHYKNLQDAPQLIDAFGHEKNAAVRSRLDFIRRQLVAG